MILSDSIRVSNELGAGNFDKAKTTMFATLKLSVLLPLLVVLALAFGHNTWSSFFINNITIMDEFSSMVPFLAISITLDSMQDAISGSVLKKTFFPFISAIFLIITIQVQG